MNDLLSNLDRPYDAIYRSLGEIRELFHRRGRVADANAKLDETIKLMAIQHAYINGRLAGDLYKPLTDLRTFSIPGLNRALQDVASKEPFCGSHKDSIFGVTPTVAFEKGEENLAFQMLHSAGLAISAQSLSSDPLDVVNEAFGHHVRDNFRSNTEDAQYMTPPEVVEFMVSLAEHELFETGDHEFGDEFVVADPSCGVGSFLVSWHRLYEQHRRRTKRLPDLVAIGQDKVDRMTRLARANLIFSSFESSSVFVGNSLDDDTPLAEYDEKVGLILTNPPFGARFSINELAKSSAKSLPFFAGGDSKAKAVDSELLFLERYIRLLEDGGLCIAVVPDGVVSAKGMAAVARQLLAKACTLRAVIELPPVTFAQAGTRTKTAVLMFRKGPPAASNIPVFFAEAAGLGFEVARRKGMTVKRSDGANDLPAILRSYVEGGDAKVVSTNDAAFGSWVTTSPSSTNVWTPRRFQRIEFQTDERSDASDFEDRLLSELVHPRKRGKAEPYSPDKLFISVLHVIGEGVLDLPSVMSYSPITPGVSVLPDQVIVSRLNPRIPRVLVVPDLGAPMLCSSEFEVLDPREGISPFALAYQMLSQVVQDRICSLTAGTSASHSRVSPELVRSILVPWPKGEAPEFTAKIAEYESANRSVIAGIFQIAALRSR